MGSNNLPNEVEATEANPASSKIARFELDVKLNNTWALDPNRVEYVDRLTQSFGPIQTVIECILHKNSVPVKIKR